MKDNLTTSQLVGFQSVALYYEEYRDKVLEMMEEEKKKARPCGFEWFLLKIFILGTIAGVRKERARRRGEKKERVL